MQLSPHRSQVGVKFPKANRLDGVMKGSDPGPTSEVANFMDPKLFKKRPTGVKFSQDEKVDILDKQYMLRESQTKPGPGRYDLPSDFC